MERPEIFMFLLVLVAAMLLFGRRQTELIRDFIEALNRFGGGGPPTHPLPANDGPWLRRRRPRKIEN